MAAPTTSSVPLNPSQQRLPDGPDDITIVGGGFCGTMTAVQLLRHATRRLHLRLVEQSPQRIARGIAYSTTDSCHLLNVPAGRMSALPEDPDHFVRWSKRHAARIVCPPWVPAVGPDAYLPRGCYGDYLAELLQETISECSRHDVEIITDEVIATDCEADGVHIRTRSGLHWCSQSCVLALGNTPPMLPGPWAADLMGTSAYHANPWCEDVLPALMRTKSCILVGSGLTMLDVVTALHRRNYAGTIHVISRRGLVPLAHARQSTQSGAALEAVPVLSTDIRTAMRQFRHAARSSGYSGGGWQSLFDAFRPYTSSAWQSLNDAQRRRFLRHIRPYWDHHRHRVAPIVRQTFDCMVATGQIVLHQGRIEQALPHRNTQEGIVLALRGRKGEGISLTGQQVVNCIGPGQLSGASGLIKYLIAGKFIDADELGMGLQADAQLRLTANGQQAEAFFALGPLVKGSFWECTAVPECRRDTMLLAQRLQGSRGALAIEYDI